MPFAPDRIASTSLALAASLLAHRAQAQDRRGHGGGFTPAPFLVGAPAPQAPVAAPAALCVPGTQIACACAGGAQGYQVCADTGMAFTPCNCPSSQPTWATAAPAAAVPALPELPAPSALRQPITFTDRPLTLPRLTLRPYLRFDVTRLAAPGSGASLDIDPVARAALGVHLGITDDFEAGVELLPVVLAPRASFGVMSVSLAYRFVRGSFDFGLGLTWFLPTGPADASELRLALPMRWRGAAARVDLTPQVTYTSFRSDPAWALSIPLMHQFAVGDSFHIGYSTGISALIGDDVDFGKTLSLPIGIETGFTVRGARGPVLDVDGFFRLPLFLNTYRKGVNFNGESWVVGLSASLYLYL